ncbi:hypothetical protein Mycch_5908 (plasmid) [Mycolicibacterium chubuense NBB4]|uniref:Uncharacterized protein n=2 Tax=Mycolicibacterium TaxID=1866885 RepID=I4BTB0_MYCCN|nr:MULTISPECIES: hypothetical protein [Mycolicibacterium]AFM20517.1 hypothetical protein Mycch_5908 [Mycolicibacterium chubuense NBB4]NTY63985.1 dihydrofolate reductase [Mycolicibacterium sphagni]
MNETILAHGGQLTSDEIAFIGGGTLFALLFPIVILVIVTRRTRSEEDDADTSAPEVTTSEAETDHPFCERS